MSALTKATLSDSDMSTMQTRRGVLALTATGALLWSAPAEAQPEYYIDADRRDPRRPVVRPAPRARRTGCSDQDPVLYGGDRANYGVRCLRPDRYYQPGYTGLTDSDPGDRAGFGRRGW